MYRTSRGLVGRLVRPAVAGLALAAAGDMTHFTIAQEPKPAVEAAEAKKSDSKLPLASVVLFNSGVGFFEHKAEVEGNAQIELQFKVDDINDLLKSMVLQDLGGGHISTVTYTSKDPITKTLKTFSIDLTENPTLAQILGQVRGERIEIAAPTKVEGTIIGLEKRQRPGAKEGEIIEIDVLNLLTEDGLKSIPLEQVSSIKLLDDELNKEFKQALALLASAHSTDKKSVTLKFAGEGKRPVRVGYIQQTPIWKTSYRLVLSDKESPLLQGWAIVENTTEEDWNDVRLTLMSGRPISFVMDLYDPLYVQRPVVEPELFASLRPQKYGQDLEQAEQLALGRPQMRSKLGGVGMGGGAAPGLAADAAMPASAPAPMEASTSMALDQNADEAAYYNSMQASAQAGEVGELFQYAISEPVSLARQRSAMLPIVNGPIEAEKVSIYNPAVQPKHPLNGLRLKNTTDLHLMQGPITVFAGGAYAGDAQIEDLPPGAERLVSYALDLDVEVAQQAKSDPERLTSVTLNKGVLTAKRKLRRTTEYTVKNGGDSEKQVLIEYPFDANWTLIEPKEPTEKTRDRYRFTVKAEAGKPAKLEVVEELVVDQQFVVSQLDAGMIQFYLSSTSVKDDVKDALREIVKRRGAIEKVVTERTTLEQQIAAISEEQSRIRENMTRLERNSELYTRYVKKFGEQEDQIETSREQIKKLTAQEQELRRQLDEYVGGLKLE